ncbi:MAG: hydrogenase maturation protease [Sedimenticola sp.]|nr:hydrogenase maturation protease [Sedimenticola sp.]
MNRTRVAIFGYGNPSRGDDALGPLLLEHLESSAATRVTDFQLQIEHATDIVGHSLLLFVDAAQNTPAPFRFSRLCAARDRSYSSHSLSPGALLSVYQTVYREPAPDAFLLAIAGYGFELGSPLSDRAQKNLDKAVAFVQVLLRTPLASSWDSRLTR